MLGGSTFSGDDLAREGEALAAAGTPAHGRICAGGARGSTTGRLAHVALANRVTNANDHPRLLGVGLSSNENASQ